MQVVQGLAIPRDYEKARFDTDLQYLCDLRDVVLQNIYYFGFHEPLETVIFCNIARESRIVFDVGAHMGYYTLLAAKRIDKAGQVHAFEPNPFNMLSLRKNIALNNFANVRLNECGVSDRIGIADFFLSGAESSLAPLQKAKLHSIHSVRTTTLDYYAEQTSIHQIDLLKMDIEGAEFRALTGASELLSRRKVGVLMLELNAGRLMAMGSSIEDVLRFLGKQGYRPVIIGKLPLNIGHVNAVFSSRMDILERMESFVRRSREWSGDVFDPFRVQL